MATTTLPRVPPAPNQTPSSPSSSPPAPIPPISSGNTAAPITIQGNVPKRGWQGVRTGVVITAIGTVLALAALCLQYQGNVINKKMFDEQSCKDCYDRDDMKMLEDCRRRTATPFKALQIREDEQPMSASALQWLRDVLPQLLYMAYVVLETQVIRAASWLDTAKEASRNPLGTAALVCIALMLIVLEHAESSSDHSVASQRRVNHVRRAMLWVTLSMLVPLEGLRRKCWTGLLGYIIVSGPLLVLHALLVLFWK